MGDAEQAAHAFRCGPQALETIWASDKGRHTIPKSVRDAESTSRGTSLYALKCLAQDAAMPLRAVKRVTGNEVPVPSVIHWKLGHFAAVVAKAANGYVVVDPTGRREPTLLSLDVLNTEGTGYFLGNPETDGFREVSDREARAVWGRGQTSKNDDDATGSGDHQSDGGGDHRSDGTGGGCGFAAYSIHTMLVSLYVHDTPLEFTPAVGKIALPLRCVTASETLAGRLAQSHSRILVQGGTVISSAGWLRQVQVRTRFP